MAPKSPRAIEKSSALIKGERVGIRKKSESILRKKVNLGLVNDDKGGSDMIVARGSRIVFVVYVQVGVWSDDCFIC